MRHHLSHLVPAVVLLCGAVATSPAVAASGEAQGVTDCSIGAWSTDEDPKGLNVRAGPGTGFAVIGRLPPPIHPDPDYEFATEVSITGSKDGWFRIDSAILDNYISDADPKTVFTGEGWVSGHLLGLLLNDMNLYEEPSTDAPVKAKLFRASTDSAEGAGPDSFIVDRLDACRGDWVEVEGSFLGTRLKGWATGTCSNQVTTCP